MPPLGVRAGEYQVAEVIASNALGTTHRARHLPTGRIAAVTLLDAVAGDPVAVLALRAELPAIARLRHPKILPVEACGEVGDVPYVVTRLPSGAEALSSRLARFGRLTRTAILRLLTGVAAAVDHAHQVGIIHGDLGPSTVLVRTDGSAVVRDFGLARLARASRPGGEANVHAGSAGYVAPELAHSDSAGPAADVYACAALAYELLTGSPPFERPPVPPSARDATLPPAADAVILRGLAVEPEARWATCGEMVRALETAMPGPRRGSWVRLAGTLRRAVADRSRRRRQAIVRAGLAGGAGLILLTVVGAVGLAARPVPAATPQTAPSHAAQAGPASPQAAAGAASLTPFIPAPVLPPMPAITISDLAPERLEYVEVQGYGFDPRQQYDILFQQGARRWLLEAPAWLNGSGAYSVRVRIPEEAEPGPALMLSCLYQVDAGLTDRCAQMPVAVRGI